jgi:hypothetical protein
MGVLSSIWKGVKKVFNVVTLGLFKKLKEWMNPEIDKEGFLITRYGSDHPIPIVYGTRKLEPIVVERNVTDQEGGAKNDTMHMLCIFCHGEIDGFTEFFFNDISWTDARWKRDGVAMFTYTTFLGTEGQTIPEGVGKLVGFNSTTSHYRGIAGVLFSFKQDKDVSVWRGEPRVSSVVRGKLCYDFRSDTTSYTENGALHLLDYLKSTAYGKGIADADLDYDAFRIVADKSDIEEGSNEVHTVTRIWEPESRGFITTELTTTESFKRFTHNNIVDTSQTIFNNMKEIANSFRGYFPDGDGRISIGCEDEATPVMQITSGQVYGEINSSSPKRKDFLNRATVRFPNILNNFEKDEVTWPESTDDSLYQEWLADDFGKENLKSVTIESCIYKAEALQFAELIVKLSRSLTQLSFIGAPELIQLEIGDVIGFSYQQLGYVEEPFMVVDMTPQEDTTVQLQLVQHNNPAYPWSTLSYDETLGGDFGGDLTDILPPSILSYEEDTTGSTGGTLRITPDNNINIQSHIVEDWVNDVLLDSWLISLSTSFTFPTLSYLNHSFRVYSKSGGGFISQEYSNLNVTVSAPTSVQNIVTGEYVASLVLPSLPKSLLETISGITSDLSNANLLMGEVVYSGDVTAASIMALGIGQTAYSLDLLRVDSKIGSKSVSAQIMDFKEVGIGYEDENGDWLIGALYARSFSEVRIDNLNGDSVSVFSFFEALENRDNELSGRIHFGVDVSGRLTGVFIEGSETSSEIILSAEKVSIVDDDGNIFQQWNTTTGMIDIFGTVRAENIIGDTAITSHVTLSPVVVDSTQGNTSGTKKSIVEFTVDAQAYARTVYIEMPHMYAQPRGSIAKCGIYYYKNGSLESSYSPEGEYDMSGPPRTFALAANESATFELFIQWVSGGGVTVPGRSYSVSVLRDTTQISFT